MIIMIIISIPWKPTMMNRWGLVEYATSHRRPFCSLETCNSSHIL